MVKMQVFFNEIAKSCGDEPCDPINPFGIDKRFPRSTPFKGLLEMGALGHGQVQGSSGTLKSVNRKKVIKYDPNKSIEELAKSNGVKVPTIRKYIQDKHIDRTRDEKILVYNRVWLEYIQDSDISQAAMARKLKMSVNTIKQYLGMEAKDIVPEEGKIGMATEHPKVKELREAIPGLQKRFERFVLIYSRHPDLSAAECLKKLNWSNDKKGDNLALVINFMQMKEFKYKFKDGAIVWITAEKLIDPITEQ
jgi:transcriptional regulator with XRE-family HTH domain